MNIPISEYAVISLEDAVIFGSMKGVVIHENRLTAIYISLKEDDGLSLTASKATHGKYIQVPVEEVQFGQDACVLKKASCASVPSHNGHFIKVGMNAFNCSGKLLGTVTSVCVDEKHAIKGICAGPVYINIENVVNIGDVILVLDGGSAAIECSEAKPEMAPCKSVEDNEVSGVAFGLDEILNDITEDTLENIEPKYQYLLSKNLINDITIGDVKYPRGSSIDNKLIEAAIKSNCLFNLIMNAED